MRVAGRPARRALAPGGVAPGQFHQAHRPRRPRPRRRLPAARHAAGGPGGGAADGTPAGVPPGRGGARRLPGRRASGAPPCAPARPLQVRVRPAVVAARRRDAAPALGAVAAPAAMSRAVFRHEAMATFFEITVAGREEAYARQAAGAAFRELDRLEGELSRFVESSDIARANRLAFGGSLVIGDDALECLLLAAGVAPSTRRMARSAGRSSRTAPPRSPSIPPRTS